MVNFVDLWLQGTYSHLLHLPTFDIVSGIGIDTMHCVYLGVVKQLVSLWFSAKHSAQRWYCGNHVEKVDKRLMEIKPPCVITRVPRSIQHHLKFWKGKYYDNHTVLNNHKSEMYMCLLAVFS